MAWHSKRFKAVAEKVEAGSKRTVAEAAQLVKENATAKFDESIEIAIRLGIDVKKSEQMIRGSVSLPKGTGKSVRVIAFCLGEMVEKAKAAGATEAGSDDLIKKITDGWADFDVAVAHPELMSKVGRLGRILGPKGLMPSPKAGTVTENVERAVREYMGGRVEYRSDSTGCLQALVGKASFNPEDIVENVNAFIEHIVAAKPGGVKGAFIRKAVLSSTMGPGVEINVSGM
jgi:large subunit ribosomal protein L1